MCRKTIFWMQPISNLWYTNVMLRFNENNEIITEEKYRAILVGLQRKEDITYSMDELAGLAEAANTEVLGKVVQTPVSYTHLDVYKRQSVHYC